MAPELTTEPVFASLAAPSRSGSLTVLEEVSEPPEPRATDAADGPVLPGGSLTVSVLLDRARDEFDALGLISYHGGITGSEAWFADLITEDVTEIRVLIRDLAAAVEQADGHLANLRLLAQDAESQFRLVDAVLAVTGPACEHEWTPFAGPIVGGELCVRCLAIRAQEVREPEAGANADGRTADSGSLTPGAVLFEQMRALRASGAEIVTIPADDAAALLAEYDRLRR